MTATTATDREAAETSLRYLAGHYTTKAAMVEVLRPLLDLDGAKRDRWLIYGRPGDYNRLLRIPLSEPTVVREVRTDHYQAKGNGRKVVATILVHSILVKDPRQAFSDNDHPDQVYVDGAPVVAVKGGGFRPHGTKRPGWHELYRSYSPCATQTLEVA